jgi:predicted PurR-regulated permease PerM
MEKTEVLLIINSVLLSIVSILFLIVGYFLKDLHKDFKQLIERVNNLYSDLNKHVNLFDRLTQVFQRQLDNLVDRVRNIEQNEKIKENEKP